MLKKIGLALFVLMLVVCVVAGSGCDKVKTAEVVHVAAEGGLAVYKTTTDALCMTGKLDSEKCATLKRCYADAMKIHTQAGGILDEVKKMQDPSVQKPKLSEYFDLAMRSRGMLEPGLDIMRTLGLDDKISDIVAKFGG